MVQHVDPLLRGVDKAATLRPGRGGTLRTHLVQSSNAFFMPAITSGFALHFALHYALFLPQHGPRLAIPGRRWPNLMHPASCCLHLLYITVIYKNDRFFPPYWLRMGWWKWPDLVLPNLKPSTKTISLRLPQHLLDSIKAAANAPAVPYQSLIKVWLQEKIQHRE
jgi:hypothetical protein